MGTFFRDTKTGKITGYSKKSGAKTPSETYTHKRKSKLPTHTDAGTPINPEDFGQEKGYTTKINYIDVQATEQARRSAEAEKQTFKNQLIMFKKAETRLEFENKQTEQRYLKALQDEVFRRQKLVSEGYKYKPLYIDEKGDYTSKVTKIGAFENLKGTRKYTYVKEIPQYTPEGSISGLKTDFTQPHIIGVNKNNELAPFIQSKEVSKIDKWFLDQQQKSTGVKFGALESLHSMKKHPFRTGRDIALWYAVPPLMITKEVASLYFHKGKGYALGQAIKQPNRFIGQIGTVAGVYGLGGFALGKLPVGKTMKGSQLDGYQTINLNQYLSHKTDWLKVKFQEVKLMGKDPFYSDFKPVDMTAKPITPNPIKTLSYKGDLFKIDPINKIFVRYKFNPSSKSLKLEQDLIEFPRSNLMENVPKPLKISKTKPTTEKYSVLTVKDGKEILETITIKDGEVFSHKNRPFKSGMVFVSDPLSAVTLEIARLKSKPKEKLDPFYEVSESYFFRDPTKLEVKADYKPYVKSIALPVDFNIFNSNINIPSKIDYKLKSDLKIDLKGLTENIITPKLKTRIETEPDYMVDLKSDLKQDLKIDLKSDLKDELKTDLTFKPLTFKPPYSEKLDYDLKIDKIKTPFDIPLLPAERKKKQFNQTSGYDVYVKEKKKFIKANKRPLKRNDALSLGGTIVNETVSATFKIKPTNTKPQQLNLNVSKWGLIGNMFNLKEKNKFIEKNRYRINTIGEFNGITVKGWLARRRRLKGWAL